MVVAVQQHRGMRRIVQVVVRHPVADAVQIDPRRIGEQQTAEMMDVAVLDHVAGRLQCAAVAAGELHTAGSGVVDPAPFDAMAAALLHFDAVLAGVADLAAADVRGLAAGDADAVAPAALDGDVAEMHVGGAAEGDHRLRQDRHRDHYLLG